MDDNKWRVENNFGRGECVFIDSIGATYDINTTSDFLELSMIYNPGYCFTVNGDTICPDYISAEIVSKEHFKYGIYEGRMKFAEGNGSWPAFWLFGGAEPDNSNYMGHASEIDIAEHNWDYKRNSSTDHVFHYWYPDGSQISIPDGIYKTNVVWDTWHKFKLIYTPYDVSFYIDDTFSWKRSRFYIIFELPEFTYEYSGI